jgi:hypothetical protein
MQQRQLFIFITAAEVVNNYSTVCWGLAGNQLRAVLS